MEFSIKSGAVERLGGDITLVGIFQGMKLSPSASVLDKSLAGKIRKQAKIAGFDGRHGETLRILDTEGISTNQILLIGCGKAAELDIAAYRRVNSAAVRVIRSTVSTAVSCLSELKVTGIDPSARTRHAVEAISAALYRFDAYKNKSAGKPNSLKKVVFALDKKDATATKTAIRTGKAIANGASYARTLGNLPGNICTPTYLAKEARKLASKNEKLKVSVLDETQMQKLGMGALLSVSRGSRQPAKLIVFEYRNGPAKQRPFAFVGKGLTFDSGGISIKPSAAMDEMKFDMCGGASVFGLIKAVAELDLPLNVVGIVPSSENMPDGDANKPGDILTSMSGQTIEVLNTDAEGRLILCDALTYCERFKPETVIDIATLTGACVIALGSHASGLLGNDENLIKDILKAGQKSHDRAWQLPLWKEYDKALKSPFADMANVGGREAGTITAASFLSRYTNNLRWAHLDVAGTAWTSGSHKGATGRPVPSLVQFLLDKL